MGKTNDGLDCAKQMETLDLALDGMLPAVEAQRLEAQLEAHLEGCADCRDERQRLLRLREALGEARIPLREGFSASVMAALPAAPWAPRRAAAPRRECLRAAVLLVALGATSALFFAATGDASGGPLGGALAAMVELAGAALVAGAGLIGASWSGLGMAIGELFAQSPGTLVGFTLLLVLLSLLLVAMLRRPRPATEVEKRR